MDHCRLMDAIFLVIVFVSKYFPKCSREGALGKHRRCSNKPPSDALTVCQNAGLGHQFRGETEVERVKCH